MNLPKKTFTLTAAVIGQMELLAKLALTRNEEKKQNKPDINIYLKGCEIKFMSVLKVNAKNVAWA